MHIFGKEIPFSTKIEKIRHPAVLCSPSHSTPTNVWVDFTSNVNQVN